MSDTSPNGTPKVRGSPAELCSGDEVSPCLLLRRSKCLFRPFSTMKKGLGLSNFDEIKLVGFATFAEKKVGRLLPHYRQNRRVKGSC